MAPTDSVKSESTVSHAATHNSGNLNLDANSAAADNAAGVKSGRTSSLWANSYLHCAALIALVLLCFGKTLTGYFLADDFGEISYVSRIFNGEPQLLWSNFTGNYMQIPGMNVYRPFLLLSLVSDFLFYGTNSVGYYATNLLYFTGDVLLVYFIARWFTKKWTAGRAALASGIGAALFAANPLRCESVTWVVGRVDIICGFYYLLSLYLFLCSRSINKRAPLLVAVGTASFWFAMTTKEMAVGLPCVLFLLDALRIDSQSTDPAPSLATRCVSASKWTLPLWASLAAYFVIRYVALGTLGGGYVAGFGASQLSLMVERWTDFDTIKRLFYPFNAALFPHPDLYSNFISISYCTVAAALAWQAINRRLDWRLAVFLLGWIATAIAPIFQLWGIGLNLEGARFYFFMSVPLMLGAPLLLLKPDPPVPANTGTSTPLPRNKDRIVLAVGGAFFVLLATMTKVTTATDMEWVRAGREVKQSLTEARNLAGQHPAGKLVLFGIPKDRNGSHQILNGITFLKAMQPPFVANGASADNSQKQSDTNGNAALDTGFDPSDAKTLLANRFETFDQIMFGPDQFINAERFNRVVSSKDFAGAFLWSSKTEHFSPVALSTGDGSSSSIAPIDLPLGTANHGWAAHSNGHADYSFSPNQVEILHPIFGDGIKLDALSIDPRASDILQFEYKATDVAPNAVWQVTAAGDKPADAGPAVANAAMKSASDFKTATVRLSHYWRWFVNGQIKSIAIAPGACGSVTIRNLQLIPAALSIPSLTAVTASTNGAGYISLAQNQSLTIAVSSRQIPSVSYFEVEIGKPNFFFDNFETNSTVNVVQTRILLAAKAPLRDQKLAINPAALSSQGFCQIRLRCLHADKSQAGEYSDTLTIKRK